MTITLSETNEEISVCQTFTLQVAVAPSLLHPPDEGVVSTRFPAFQWNSASMKAGIRIRYRIRITELKPGQSPQQALESNPAVFTTENLAVPTCVYPVRAESLKSGLQYVWRVQAFDEYGSPLGDNNGKSEIRVFRYIEGGEE